MNKYHKGTVKTHEAPPPTGKRAAQPGMPDEKPVTKGGLGNAYGARKKQTAGFPHVKSYVSGDY